MLLAASEKGQLDAGVAHRQVHALALVVDVEHVDTLSASGEKPPELSGPIGDARPDDEVTAGPGEGDIAPPRISRLASMLPPERTAQAGPVAWNLPGQQRRDGRGAGTLDDELRALEQQHDRVRDLLVRHGHDRLEALLEDRAW